MFNVGDAIKVQYTGSNGEVREIVGMVETVKDIAPGSDKRQAGTGTMYVVKTENGYRSLYASKILAS
jgi:hypothetical protein